MIAEALARCCVRRFFEQVEIGTGIKSARKVELVRIVRIGRRAHRQNQIAEL